MQTNQNIQWIEDEIWLSPGIDLILTTPNSLRSMIESFFLHTPTPRKLNIMDSLMDSNCLTIGKSFLASRLVLLQFREINFTPILDLFFTKDLTCSGSWIYSGVGIQQKNMSSCMKASKAYQKFIFRVDKIRFWSGLPMKGCLLQQAESMSNDNKNSMLSLLTPCQGCFRFCTDVTSSFESSMILESSRSTDPISYFWAKIFDSSTMFICRQQ